MSAQAEAHKTEVQEPKRKVAEATEKFEVEVVKHEICEIERSIAQKNVDELRAGKEKCYDISMDCAKNLKNYFLKLEPSPLSKNSSAVTLLKLSSGSVGRPKLFNNFLVTEGIFVPSRVPVGLYQFWKRSARIMPRLLFNQNLFSQSTTIKTLQSKLLH
jgi:hypothetical protein